MPIKKYLPLALKQRVRSIQNQIRLINATHVCPVCESPVVSFLPMPDFYRENLKKYGFSYRSNEAETCNEAAYLCPNCQATDRDRLYALFLRDFIIARKNNSPMEIVEFGPSPPFSAFVHRLIKSSGNDIHYRTADLLASDVDDRADITELLTYEDEQLDFFICSHVLEHVTDDKKAIRELHRVLKPGAQGILMVPIILSIDEIDEDLQEMSEAERWRRFGQFDHVRLYSKRGFLERVREAGFEVNELGKEFFGVELFNRAGINSQSVLYVVEKPDRQVRARSV